nr:MAG TPA: hypothetical protein [Caudoviricetes sp.]
MVIFVDVAMLRILPFAVLTVDCLHIHLSSIEA